MSYICSKVDYLLMETALWAQTRVLELTWTIPQALRMVQHQEHLGPQILGLRFIVAVEFQPVTR